MCVTNHCALVGSYKVPPPSSGAKVTTHKTTVYTNKHLDLLNFTFCKREAKVEKYRSVSEKRGHFCMYLTKKSCALSSRVTASRPLKILGHLNFHGLNRKFLTRHIRKLFSKAHFYSKMIWRYTGHTSTTIKSPYSKLLIRLCTYVRKHGFLSSNTRSLWYSHTSNPKGSLYPYFASISLIHIQ
jgi:hypothetical protein